MASPLVEKWKQMQLSMQQRLVVAPLTELPRFVAGADMAFSADKRTAYAAAVVYDRIEQRIVEVVGVRQPVKVPYIPGYLSFREGPALLKAIGRLRHPWGALCCDGQGTAHPRRCGLACHVGVMLDVPTVGVAKSRLIGTFEEPGAEAGSAAPLMAGTERIGVVLRTRNNVRPLFVSVGHRMDLPSAQALVLACVTRYRLPEPTRQADIEVAKLKARYAS